MPREKKGYVPGTNRKMLANALEAWKLPRIDTKDPYQVAERLEKYFNYCLEGDFRPSVVGMANWIGVSEQTVKNWYTGKKMPTTDHQALMTRAYGILQQIWNDSMVDGTMNPVSGIYMSKVHFGYKDTADIVVQTQENNVYITNDELIKESLMFAGKSQKKLSDSIIDIPAEVITESVETTQKGNN